MKTRSPSRLLFLAALPALAAAAWELCGSTDVASAQQWVEVRLEAPAAVYGVALDLQGGAEVGFPETGRGPVSPAMFTPAHWQLLIGNDWISAKSLGFVSNDTRYDAEHLHQRGTSGIDGDAAKNDHGILPPLAVAFINSVKIEMRGVRLLFIPSFARKLDVFCEFDRDRGAQPTVELPQHSSTALPHERQLNSGGCPPCGPQEVCCADRCQNFLVVTGCGSLSSPSATPRPSESASHQLTLPV